MPNNPSYPLHLIAFKGHPATGKSALAHALARQLGWPLLDKDDVKDHLLALPEGNTLAYAILWQMATTQLRLGVSVIVDSPLSYAIGYTTACQLAQSQPARLLVVETQLAEERWRARLESRPAGESAHKIRGWAAMQQLLTRYNGWWCYPIDPAHHLLVDTSLPVEQLVTDIRVYLDLISRP